jgi:hypothetical protein
MSGAARRHARRPGVRFAEEGLMLGQRLLVALWLQQERQRRAWLCGLRC